MSAGEHSEGVSTVSGTTLIGRKRRSDEDATAAASSIARKVRLSDKDSSALVSFAKASPCTFMILCTEVDAMSVTDVQR